MKMKKHILSHIWRSLVKLYLEDWEEMLLNPIEYGKDEIILIVNSKVYSITIREL